MTEIAFFQIAIYFFILFLSIPPLGFYMAQVFEAKPCGLDYFVKPLEQLLYNRLKINKDAEMNWKQYASAMLIFNFFGFLFTYIILRLQFYLPLNPQSFPSPNADLVFNTAISFATNTNWQAYAGEQSISYLTQMLAFTVQNFMSAATSIALLMVFIRGIVRHETNNLGNFWVDLTRCTLYILLPLSLVFAIFLSSQGVIQNFKPYQKTTLLELKKEQIIPMGPVASQVAIKQLGSNGGGFFNVNAAHPFENPSALSNFFQMIAILLIPAALCYTFGLMVKDKRQGFAILTAMFLIFLPFSLAAIMIEQKTNPALLSLGVDPNPQIDAYPAGNMEGKETRFGIVDSAFWATATTATSNGSVNSMHDSYLPLSGMVTLWMMHLNEVIFGGVGSGLYGMLMFIILTVFVSGLMVGRSPEYLGKKIEPYEMKMASISVLVIPLMVLIFTAIATSTEEGRSAISNPGPHGLTEILYTFTSMINNNGSAFAGLNANRTFYNLLGGIAILIGRYFIIISVLATAGSLAQKKWVPISSGTLPTHTPLFIILLVCVTVVLGALSFLPVLALGPLAEHFILWGTHAR